MLESGKETVWTLSEPLILTVHLNPDTNASDIKASGGFRFIDPTPLVAYVENSPLEQPAIYVSDLHGDTEDPLNPYPLLRLEGSSIYTGEPVVWETVWHRVLILGSDGIAL